ncbi:MAG: hypothetical protein ACFFDT_25610 [Candidatus Hodarchaeota archaeon]
MKTTLKTKIDPVHESNVFLNFKLALNRSLSWGFISALVVGGFAAGLWTLIPTRFLTWGSSKVNLIGYVSHCPFVPFSTLLLMGCALIGVILTLKMKGKNPIGITVFIFGLLGLFFGMINGIDVDMFITGGYGIGTGMFLSLLMDLRIKNRVAKKDLQWRKTDE